MQRRRSLRLCSDCADRADDTLHTKIWLSLCRTPLLAVSLGGRIAGLLDMPRLRPIGSVAAAEPGRERAHKLVRLEGILVAAKNADGSARVIDSLDESRDLREERVVLKKERPAVHTAARA